MFLHNFSLTVTSWECDIQIVIITNFVVESGVGIKRVVCMGIFPYIQVLAIVFVFQYHSESLLLYNT